MPRNLASTEISSRESFCYTLRIVQNRSLIIPRLSTIAKKAQELPSDLRELRYELVVPAWTAGTQVDMDVSARILRAWMPEIHAGMTEAADGQNTVEHWRWRGGMHLFFHALQASVIS